MAWIQTTGPEEATGRWNEVYDELQEKFPIMAGDRKESPLFNVLSLHPDFCLNLDELFRTIQFGNPPLDEVDEQIVATEVSGANDCHYCRGWKWENFFRKLHEPIRGKG